MTLRLRVILWNNEWSRAAKDFKTSVLLVILLAEHSQPQDLKKRNFIGPCYCGTIFRDYGKFVSIFSVIDAGLSLHIVTSSKCICFWQTAIVRNTLWANQTFSTVLKYTAVTALFILHKVKKENFLWASHGEYSHLNEKHGDFYFVWWKRLVFYQYKLWRVSNLFENAFFTSYYE